MSGRQILASGSVADRPQQACAGLRARHLVLLLLVLVVLGAGGAGAYYYFRPRVRAFPFMPSRRKRAAVAAVPGLDASGYVVARRQATLSGQIIGKLVYLNAEEGQRVKQGDVVARLDDSNYSAALRQAAGAAAPGQGGAGRCRADLSTRYQRLQSQNAISTDQFENERAAYDAARTAVAVAEARR